MSRVSAIVVHWNSRPELAPCLSCLQGSDELDVVVVDNASPDGGEQEIRSSYPTVRWLSAGRNSGFGAAINAGARASRGSWILALNPDTRIEAATVLAMARAAEELGATVLGPRIVDSDGRPENSCEPRDSAWGDLLRPLAFRRLLPAISIERPRPVAWLTGACLLLERAAFERAGGFDEGFFLYFEDADLCRRIRAAGGRVMFHPGFIARHARGASGRGREAEISLHYRASQLRYLRLHRGTLFAGLVRAWLHASAAVSRAPWHSPGRREHGRALERLLRASERRP